MSGGSYDYAYARVRDMADSMMSRRASPLRAAFAKHLRLVADAMRAVEWVDSNDDSPGSEDEAIRACLAPGAELDAATERARDAIDDLARAIERAEKVR